MYIVRRYNIYLYNNVRILCLSFNVKKPKPSAKLSKMCRNKRRSNRLLWYPLRSPRSTPIRYQKKLYIGQ